ncbi:MAG: iron ABC transporter permease [Bacteroidales bacterium]|jgi:iron complex transport system permease protein|nr:iron ABC transporter permease [Bacteroidales bacterium]
MSLVNPDANMRLPVFISRLLPFLFCIILLLSAFIASTIGVVPVSWGEVWQILILKIMGKTAIPIPDNLILAITELRLPRIVMSLLAGGGLAVCGALFQSIFRNPLCDPYMLGVSSGASLGAALAFVMGWHLLWVGVALPALATALLTLLLVLGVSRIGYRRDSTRVLLTGIALNFLISAIITLLIVANQQEMSKIIFWTMGSFASVNWHDIGFLLPVVVLAIGVLFYHAKELDIMQMGTDIAQTLGVNTGRCMLLTLLFASLLIATIVSICGVIGFIGLIIPHMVRLYFGNHNKDLFLYSFFFGAFFMLTADTIARTLALPSELPVGSITALAGTPYFLYLLLKRRCS